MNIERTVELVEERCYECGRYWAHELYGGVICPHCASARVDRVLNVQAELRRSNAALRGALKRGRK